MPTTPPTITALPAAPTRGSTTFRPDADTYLGAFPRLRMEVNGVASWMETTAVEVLEDASQAATSAATAESARTLAVGAANYKGDYAAGTAYQIGESVSYGGFVFVAKTVNLGVTPVDGANWLKIKFGKWIQIGSDITVSSAVSSVDITSIPTTYSELLLEYSGMSHDSGSSAEFILRASDDNGAGFTSGGIALEFSSSSTTITGRAMLVGRDVIYGVDAGSGHATGASPIYAPGASGIFAMTGKINALRISANAANIDAGTFTLYGR